MLGKECSPIGISAQLVADDNNKRIAHDKEPGRLGACSATRWSQLMMKVSPRSGVQAKKSRIERKREGLVGPIDRAIPCWRCAGCCRRKTKQRRNVCRNTPLLDACVLGCSHTSDTQQDSYAEATRAPEQW